MISQAEGFDLALVLQLLQCGESVDPKCLGEVKTGM